MLKFKIFLAGSRPPAADEATRAKSTCCFVGICFAHSHLAKESWLVLATLAIEHFLCALRPLIFFCNTHQHSHRATRHSDHTVEYPLLGCFLGAGRHLPERAVTVIPGRISKITSQTLSSRLAGLGCNFAANGTSAPPLA